MLYFLFFSLSDPGFNLSYHLLNQGQFGGVPNEDINVLPVWEKGYSGNGIHIAFLAHGCFYENIDLIPGFNLKKSYNFATKTRDVAHSDPMNLVYGNSAIGIAVARKNGLGMIGVAFNSNFSIVVINSQVSMARASLLPEIISGFLDDDIRVDYSSMKSYYMRSRLKFRAFRYDPEVADHLIDAMYRGRRRLGTIYVIPAFSRKRDDYSYIPQSVFSNFGEVITVSMSNSVGTADPYTIPSVEILVNSPGPGFHYPSSLNTVPPLISISGWDSGSYYELPYFHIAASTVSGVISLLIEANPLLTSRDIQWILLLGATKNDPLNDLWIKNSAGFEYNTLYGFGRVDCNASLFLGQHWITLPRIKKLIKSVDINREMPFANQGYLDIEMDIDSKYGPSFFEYGYLKFNYSNIDFSMMRIFVESPSGTVFQVFQPIVMDEINGDKVDFVINEPICLLMRCFFGETISGKWKISFIDESYSRGNILTFVSLEFYGIDNFPSFPTAEKRVASDCNKWEPRKSKYFSINISESSIYCDSVIAFCANWNGEPIDDSEYICSIHLRNIDTGKMIFLSSMSVTPPFSRSIYIPCLFNETDKMEVMFYFDMMNEYVSFPIRNVTKCQNETIITPNPYRVFFSEISRPISLPVKICSNVPTTYFSPPHSARIIALYNLDTNRRILSYYTNTWWHDSITLESRTMARNAIVVISPIFSYKKQNCSSYLIPIHVITAGDHAPNAFPIEVNDLCPVLNGVVVSHSTPTKSSPALAILWGAALPLVLIILLTISFIVAIWRINTRHVETNLDGRFLFD